MAEFNLQEELEKLYGISALPQTATQLGRVQKSNQSKRRVESTPSPLENIPKTPRGGVAGIPIETPERPRPAGLPGMAGSQDQILKPSKELIDAYATVGVKLDPKKRYLQSELSHFQEIAKIRGDIEKAKVQQPPSDPIRDALKMLNQSVDKRLSLELKTLQGQTMSAEDLNKKRSAYAQEEAKKLSSIYPQLSALVTTPISNPPPSGFKRIRVPPAKDPRFPNGYTTLIPESNLSVYINAGAEEVP